MLYMVTWIPSIYPSHVSIYTSTMDPMGLYVIFIIYRLIFPHWIAADDLKSQQRPGKTPRGDLGKPGNSSRVCFGA